MEACQVSGCVWGDENIISFTQGKICRTCMYHYICNNLPDPLDPFTQEPLSKEVLEDMELYVENNRYFYSVVNSQVKPFAPNRKVELTMIWFCSVGDLLCGIYSHYPNLVLFTAVKYEERLLGEELMDQPCGILCKKNRFSTRLTLVKARVSDTYLVSMCAYAIKNGVTKLTELLSKYFENLKKTLK